MSAVVESARRRDADRLGRRALLMLLGIPATLLVQVVWQFLMQTSAGYDDFERVRGWSAVLRELPATALLWLPIVVGLPWAIRSARSGSRRGLLGIWLYSLAILVIASAVVQGTAELVSDAGPAVLGWAILLGAATLAITALVLSLRAAARSGSPPADRRSRAGEMRRLAALLAVIGIVVSFGWLLAAQLALSSHVRTFPRAGIGQTLQLYADDAGTRYLYAERTGAVSTTSLGIQVTAADGTSIPVTVVPPTPAYLHGGRAGTLIGSFPVARGGRYRIAMTSIVATTPAPFAPQNPYGELAAGGDVTGWMRPHEWGAAVLLVVSMAGSLALAAAARRGFRARTRMS